MSKKVLVIGAARSGIAASNLLLNHGYDVLLTDNKGEEKIVSDFPELEELRSSSDNRAGHIEFLFGEQIDPDKVEEFEFIVPSPGVPETIPVLARAIERDIPILSEPELAYRLSESPFVAITGTNGKTTTTTLTGKIFENAGINNYVVGNIGEAISNYVDLADKDTVFVTEIGSFQLSRCYDFKPKGSIILNITPDHLDRHKTMENYIQAKARIFQSQDEEDFFILNIDDPILKELPINQNVRVLEMSLEKEVDNGAFLKDSTLMINDDGNLVELVTAEELGIKGKHNIQNALGASALAYFYGIPVEKIRETLKEFKGVEHRQEPVNTIDGVKYINDSKGTNTDATITALNAMSDPVILIAGGYDKKEPYDLLAEKIKETTKLVILIGETAQDIKETLNKHDYHDILLAKDLEEATELAKENAAPNEVVLLSPACASWDMFDNYEQRGDLFKQIVNSFETR